MRKLNLPRSLVVLATVGFMVSVGCSRSSSAQPEAFDVAELSEEQVITEQAPASQVKPTGFNADTTILLALPLTCDLLSHVDAAAIFGEEGHVSDETVARHDRAPVEVSCLIKFGHEDESPEERRNRRFRSVRADFYSNESYSGAGWGTLQHNWDYRTGDPENQFVLMNGIKAGWVDSEHPPDQSLLVFLSDYMLELGYWPPSSFRGAPEANSNIESLARAVLEEYLVASD